MKLKESIIHQYIKGELKGEELIDFNKKIEFILKHYKKAFFKKGMNEEDIQDIFKQDLRLAMLNAKLTNKEIEVSFFTILKHIRLIQENKKAKKNNELNELLDYELLTVHFSEIKHCAPIYQDRRSQSNSIQDFKKLMREQLKGEALASFEANLKKIENSPDEKRIGPILIKNYSNLDDEVEVFNEIDTVLMKNHLDLDDEVYAKEKEKLQPLFDEVNEKYFKVQKQKENQSEKQGSGKSEDKLSDASNNNESLTLIRQPLQAAVIRRLLPFGVVVSAASLLLFIFNPFINKLSPVELADQYFEPYFSDSTVIVPPKYSGNGSWGPSIEDSGFKITPGVAKFKAFWLDWFGNSKCHIDDWTALKALYESTNGDNWTNQMDWKIFENTSNVPKKDCNLANLYGVYLGIDGRVEAIDLNHNQLKGNLTLNLEKLSCLKFLNLQGNQLNGSSKLLTDQFPYTIPEELVNLKNMMKLNHRSSRNDIFPIDGKEQQLLSQASEFYQNNQIDKAILYLQELIDIKYLSDVYKQKANWYLALCYLKKDHPDIAWALLDELKEYTEYEKDAKAILKQLK